MSLERLKALLQILIPCVILFGGGFLVYLMLERPLEAAKTQDASPQKLRTVEAKYVVPRERRISVISHGFVQPQTSSSISAGVAGKIISTSGDFQVGKFFKIGDEILRIDPTDYETAVSVAKSNLATSQRFLDEEKKTDAWKEKAREAHLKEAESRVTAAQAELDRAEANLSRSIVCAPFNGLLANKLVEIGQYVTPGMVMASLHSVDTAEIRVPVDVETLPFLDLPSGPKRNRKFKQEVDVRFNGDYLRHGTIVRSENIIDEKTRSLYFVAEIKDPYLWFTEPKVGQHALRIGQYVEVSMLSQPIDKLVELPSSAMRGGNEVVVASNAGKLTIQEVEEIYSTADLVYVRGLTEGQSVVVSAPLDAISGERVEVVYRSEPETTQTASNQINQ